MRNPSRPLRHWLPISALLLVLGVAQSPAQAAGNDLTARVSPAGLDFIAAELPDLLPNSFTLAGYEKSFSSCSKLTIPPTPMKFTVKSIDISPQSGTIKVVGSVTSFSGTGSVSLSNIPGICIWGLSCGGQFGIAKGTVTVTFKLAIVGNKIELQSPTASATIYQSDVSVNLNNCGGVGTAVSWILDNAPDSIRQWLIDKGKDALIDWAIKKFEPEIEDMLSDFTSYSGTLQGFKITGTLKGVDASSSGISANASLSVATTTSQSSSCPQGSKPAPVTTTGEPNFGSHGEHVAVGISRAMLSDALIAAWDSGLLCLPMSRLKSLGLSTTMLGPAGFLLGLTSLDSIDVNAPKAPSITLVSGNGARADLTADDFTITMGGQSANGPTTITIKLKAVLHLVLDLDPINRAVTIESLTIDLSNIDVSASPSQGLTLDAATVKTLLETIVMPLVIKEVEGTDLVPHVVHKDGGPLDSYYLYLVLAYTDANFVKLYAKLFEKVSSDSTNPTTKLDEKPGPLVKPQIFRFVASGTDNATPEDLLRFSWRIDGGSWSYSSYSRAWYKELKGGSHKVEVRARDLHGNYDATPASVSFDVDAEQPVINVTSAPSGTIQSGPAQVDFTVSDDRTAPGDIEVKVLVTLSPAGGGSSQTLQDDPYAKGVNSVTVASLQPGSYTVKLNARDEAGNESSSTSISFSYQQPAPPQSDLGLIPQADSGGPMTFDDGGVVVNPNDPSVNQTGCSCTVAAPAADSGPTALLWLLLLGLVPWRRRSR